MAFQRHLLHIYAKLTVSAAHALFMDLTDHIFHQFKESTNQGWE
jgi:hypothetical protein